MLNSEMCIGGGHVQASEWYCDKNWGITMSNNFLNWTLSFRFLSSSVKLFKNLPHYTHNIIFFQILYIISS